MKNVGLKFLLVDQMFFMAIMSEQKAREILNKWMSREYHIKGVQTIGDISPPQGGESWSVQVDAIRAIHTVDLEALQRQAGQPMFSPNAIIGPGKYTSGY